MPSVLFVCTANRFRSPLAAARFSQCLQGEADVQDWRVGSAGTWAELGLPAFPHAGWAKEHFGIDLAEHRTTRIDRDLVAQYDLILAMANGQQEALRVEFPEVKNHIFLLAKVATGLVYDITDPGAMRDDSNLEIAREIIELINKGYKNICWLARKLDRHKMP
jgi:protein-tyrosine phosphatase